MELDDRLNALYAYVQEVRDRPYEPVRHNCALFAAGALKIFTDRDFVAELGITLESERDMLRVLAEHDGLRGLVTYCIGSEMQPPLLARRGDLMLKEGENGETVGVCMGDHALFLGPDGLQRRELMECLGCWRVS